MSSTSTPSNTRRRQLTGKKRAKKRKRKKRERTASQCGEVPERRTRPKVFQSGIRSTTGAAFPLHLLRVVLLPFLLICCHQRVGSCMSWPSEKTGARPVPLLLQWWAVSMRAHLGALTFYVALKKKYFLLVRNFHSLVHIEPYMHFNVLPIMLNFHCCVL